MSKTVSFTGHRAAAYDFSSTKAYEMRNRLSDAIRKAVLQGFDVFCTGMAQGFDMIAAEAVLHERDNLSPHIRLTCIIPHKGQEHKWERPLRLKYELITSLADEVLCLNDSYISGCFHERNRQLVKRADRLICLYSGKAGGTRHTVQLAEEKGIEIVNIWEE